MKATQERKFVYEEEDLRKLIAEDVSKRYQIKVLPKDIIIDHGDMTATFSVREDYAEPPTIYEGPDR